MANMATRPAKPIDLARDPHFVMGIKDFCAGTWGADFIPHVPDQWTYERGRQLAALVFAAGHDPMRLVGLGTAPKRADLLLKAVKAGAIR